MKRTASMGSWVGPAVMSIRRVWGWALVVWLGKQTFRGGVTGEDARNGSSRGVRSIDSMPAGEHNARSHPATAAVGTGFDRSGAPVIGAHGLVLTHDGVRSGGAVVCGRF
jgi:hypothetical protein